MGEIEANRSTLVKDMGKLCLTIGAGGALTAITAGQSAPAVGKEVLSQLSNIVNNPEVLSPDKKDKIDDMKEKVDKFLNKVKNRYGSGDPFKENEQLAKKLYKLIEAFSNSIKRAHTLEECSNALIHFQVFVMHESMTHLEHNGSKEQRKDIKSLRTFVNGYADLLRKLNQAAKTESNLEQFQQQMMKLVDELKESPRMDKLVNDLTGKQLNNLVNMEDMLTISRIFGKYPQNLTLTQKSGHTCYMLSILDSILHSGQANQILNRIKVTAQES